MVTFKHLFSPCTVLDRSAKSVVTVGFAVSLTAIFARFYVFTEF